MKKIGRMIGMIILACGLFASSITMTFAASAPKKPDKCPKCGANYSIVRSTNIKKTITQSNKTVYKKANQPLKNASDISIYMGGFKSKSTSVSYSADATVEWKMLKLSANYTKKDTKTSGFFAGGLVKPGYWCNTYIKHVVDVCTIEDTTTDKCPHCGYKKNYKEVASKIWLPKKSSGVEIKFVTSKKKADVNKDYL